MRRLRHPLSTNVSAAPLMPLVALEAGHPMSLKGGGHTRVRSGLGLPP